MSACTYCLNEIDPEKMRDLVIKDVIFSCKVVKKGVEYDIKLERPLFCCFSHMKNYIEDYVFNRANYDKPVERPIVPPLDLKEPEEVKE